MNAAGLYEVLSPRAYRGHPPGSTFQARIDRFAERRAVDRGDIRLLARITPTLQPGSYTLPQGWPTAPRGGE